MAKVMPSIHGRNRQQARAWGTSVSAPNTAGTQAYMGDDYDQSDNLYDEAWGPVESQAEAIAMHGYMTAQEPTGPSYPVKSTCTNCGADKSNCDCN